MTATEQEPDTQTTPNPSAQPPTDGQPPLTAEEVLNGRAPEPEAERDPGRRLRPMERLGKWAYKHHDFLNSKTGQLGIRNGLGCVWSIFWLMFPFVGAKFGLQRMAEAMQKPGGGFKGGAFGEAVNRFGTDSGVQNFAAIAASFSTFRITNRAWRFCYDLLAEKHPTEEAAIATGRNLTNAHNQYLKRYTVPEFASTIPAALPLALIQAKYTVKGHTAADNKGVKGWAYSLGGAWPAYWGFFGVTRNIFKFLTGNDGGLKSIIAQEKNQGDTPEAVKVREFVEKAGIKEHLSYQRVPDDAEPLPLQTLAEKVTGGIKSALAISFGIALYYGAKRPINKHFGNMNPAKGGDSFWRAWHKEHLGLQSFFTFTVGEEIAQRALNKPFQKIAHFFNNRAPKERDSDIMMGVVSGNGAVGSAMATKESAVDSAVDADCGCKIKENHAAKEKSKTRDELVAAGARPLGASNGATQIAPTF